MVFSDYIKEINNAYGRGDATEHTHRPALKSLIESLDKKITATNEPKRQECGAPDFIVSRRVRSLDRAIGYIEAKDIDKSLAQEAKKEQIKKRYLPSLHNLIFTNYIDFRWYVDGELRESATLGREGAGGEFVISEDGAAKVKSLLKLFLSQEAVKIKNAEALATKMASITRLMRDVIRKTFESESEQGQLHSQYKSFKQILLHDLAEDEFADMYAQTIAYGLFAARCHINDITVYGKDDHAAFHGVDGKANEFTREKAAWLLPKTNPFLRKIFGDIAGPEMDGRISWLVDDLVALLRNADMGAVLRGFAGKGKKKDPVIHFYETFLAKYDAKLRESRGVYYTPEPVVSYIVRSVDWILKEKFGMKKGLADNSKVKVKIKTEATKKVKGGKKKVEQVEEIVEKEIHKCLILDPAAGTGTFLYEVIKEIHKKFARNKGAWGGYVKEHLLPRIFGFELMMAPYAIAHMKLGLELADSGYEFDSDERLKVYLTNTLEEAEESDDMPLFMFALAEEARAANEIKRDMPVMVVLGNPPYSNFGMMNKGQWIQKLIEDYKKGLNEKKLNLDDDFIKFIRYGQHRIEQTGSGILAFITNNTYIDGITHRRMRESLMETFTEIYILDLHGSSKKKEKCPDGSNDVNVFDIQQGVSISIFVKEPRKEESARIYHADLYGLRKNKYNWLNENDVSLTSWKAISPKSKNYFFVPKDFSHQSEFLKCWSIERIFGVHGSGIKTDRDPLFLDFDSSILKSRMKSFYSKNCFDPDYMKRFNIKNSSSYKLLERRENTSFEQDNIHKILYRPFDIRDIYYCVGITSRPARKVMRHMEKDNIGLIAKRQARENLPYTWFYVTSSLLIDGSFAIDNKGRERVFPIYLYPEETKQCLFGDDGGDWDGGVDGRVPNLDKCFVDEFAGKLGMDFVSDGKGDLKKTFGPEDLFGYIYGVFHSPGYRGRYAEFLKIDFPRVPMTGNKKLFRELSVAGNELVGFHLMECDGVEDTSMYPAFDVEGEGEVEKGYPRYVAEADKKDNGKVYINDRQYFEGVGADVWEFCVGGYQVCEKWLKDRRGRKLSYDDIEHYQKITVAIGGTTKGMKEIDDIIDSHGGWPIT